MDQTFFNEPEWYRAMTLTERAASQASAAPCLQRPHDAGLARQRLLRWRSALPLGDGPAFTRRLALDGLGEERFLGLISEPIEAVRGRFPTPPGWLAELAESFNSPRRSQPVDMPAELRDRPAAGFLVAVEPLIDRGRQGLRQGVRALASAGTITPFDSNTVEELLSADLPARLLWMLGRAMVLELNVARLQDLLTGDTPEDRFRSFLERLRRRETAAAFLQEYPVLARQLVRCIDHCVAAGLEFLRHLCDDWSAIRAAFSPANDPGRLTRLHGSQGDSHRGGRSVLIAEFDSGLRVVYKPRSLAVDVHFQELLTWLNEKGADPPFRTLTVLDRGTHGWTEFVAACACTSEDEVRRFYQRQGGYLALLHVLGATDFHHENLIASGEHPVLIDLEALFHPHVGRDGEGEATGLAGQMLYSSVLRVGLLPQRLWAADGTEGIDISGLGSTDGQMTPFSIPRWDLAGTDEMRLVRRRVPIPGKDNRPALDGEYVEVLAYTDAVAGGFERIHRSLMAHRESLVADDGLLVRFAEDEVRIVLRPTRTYAGLLGESFHPDLLRDALDRDSWFDGLWAAVENLPELARVIPAEREDLLNGDIPRFTAKPGLRDLWTGPEGRIADFFDEPGLAFVRRRLRQQDEDDLARQLWIIRSSLATLATGTDRARWPTYRLAGPDRPAGRERMLAAARTVGDRLGRLAVRSESEASWLGLTLTGDDRWALAPLGTDLYSGLPGVALFLAYLGAVTGEDRHTALSRAALATLRRELEVRRPLLKSVGGFAGWGGVIYALTHLGVLWGEPELLREAEALVDGLPALIDRDEHHDVIDGTAGCIGGLICLHQCSPSPQALAAAVRCGDRLVDQARTLPRGIGWVRPGMGAALTGFSHGGAGVAWALADLASLTGLERFRVAAQASLAYERSQFCPSEGVWRDLRERTMAQRPSREGRPAGMTGWCHGAVGIGLGRLRALRHSDDEALRAEIHTALRATMANGFGMNHCLCHGDLGNLELLVQAGDVLDDPQCRTEVDRLGAMILESIERDGWRCGVPLGIESPGLMTGLAGIGYGLLRLAKPALVPSVLTLEPPKSDSITRD